MSNASPLAKLLSLLVLLVVTSSSASAQTGAREVMADAMSRMMEAMGLFDSAPSMGEWKGLSPGMPWGSPVQDPSRSLAMRELMKQFSRQMTFPGASAGEHPLPWRHSRLEGIWEGLSGDLLIVQGDRFRIYSPHMQSIDGLIRIQGNRVALYNPLDDQARPFEFAASEGRLVMRDLDDQYYLYRRLRLDGGQGRVGHQRGSAR